MAWCPVRANHFPRSSLGDTRRRVKVINSPPSGGSKEATRREVSRKNGGGWGRVCQREPNEIVLKFHLAARRTLDGGEKGRRGCQRGMEAIPATSKTTRARILKLVALGQNEGKSSVFQPPKQQTLKTNPAPWKYEILRRIQPVKRFYALICIYTKGILRSGEMCSAYLVLPLMLLFCVKLTNKRITRQRFSNLKCVIVRSSRSERK